MEPIIKLSFYRIQLHAWIAFNGFNNLANGRIYHNNNYRFSYRIYSVCSPSILIINRYCYKFARNIEKTPLLQEV